MKSKKGQKVSKAEKSKESDLEEKAEKKIKILPEEKKPEKEEEFNELDAEGIISAQELRRILESEAKLHHLENAPVTHSLEKGLVFAPRIAEKQQRGKIYSDSKYDKKYNEDKYAERTPGSYAERESSQEKGSSENSNAGNR
jgi:hypothetical protein